MFHADWRRAALLLADWRRAALLLGSQSHKTNGYGVVLRVGEGEGEGSHGWWRFSLSLTKRRLASFALNYSTVTVLRASFLESNAQTVETKYSESAVEKCKTEDA